MNLTTDGKFLSSNGTRFQVRGVAYGTFAPDGAGWQYPDPATVASDFAAMAAAGLNTIRVYTPPPLRLLDAAAEHGLRVMSGLSWPQHLAFLDDRRLCRRIRAEATAEAQRIARHPAVALLAIGNEIPASIVRWHGPVRIERFLRGLHDAVKAVAPETPVTYVNYPPTEYLELPFIDVVGFNVYLHREEELRAYIARLQHVAGNRPLLLAEAGADSLRNGEDGQARLVEMQLRAALQGGACGSIAFTWTDEWWRGGQPVTDWAFGLVDRRRRPKAALRAAARAFADGGRPARAWPRVSVVVCAYNAGETLEECLRSLAALDYPDAEVIVVDDGSTDATPDVLRRYPEVRVVRVANGGLSAARNIGLSHATGEIVAYLDADAHVEPDWLLHLVDPILSSGFAGTGGPNIVPPDDPWFAQCVARAPGGPNHVLFDDVVAEHVPGCNMAFRRDVLRALDGFNPIFRAAGDDVDLCWRLQARGWKIGFAPCAVVWHHHRTSLRAFWRQQVGYGEGETWLRPLHPDKFIGTRAQWRGHIYSPLPFIRSLRRSKVNAGVWGLAAFPSVYRYDAHSLAHLPHSGRWQLTSLALLLIGVALMPLAIAPLALSVIATGALGLGLTFVRCLQFSAATDVHAVPPVSGLPRAMSDIAHRSALVLLHFVQPMARAYGQLRGFLVPPPYHHHPRALGPALPVHRSAPAEGRPSLWGLLAGGVEDQYWSERWVQVESLLRKMTDWLRLSRAVVMIEIDDGWSATRDFSVATGLLHCVDVRAVVEDHGGGRCLLRVRSKVRPTRLGDLTAVLLVLGVGVVTLANPTGDWRQPALGGGLLFAIAGALVSWHVVRTAALVRQAVAKVIAEHGLIALDVRGRATPGRAGGIIKTAGAVAPTTSREG